MTQSRLSLLLDRIRERGSAECLVDRGRAYSCAELERRCRTWTEELRTKNIPPRSVVAVQSDYAFDSVALVLALMAEGFVAALLPALPEKENLLLEDAQSSGLFRRAADGWTWTPRAANVSHPLLSGLLSAGGAGFIIFSSGSTGRHKAILHDIDRFLTKFESANKAFRTITFLMFDHIAGLDTLFYSLAGGGVLVLPEKRDTDYVCRLIQDAKVEVLPTSPTFLKMMLLSRDYERYDLSSLKVITYGSEPMDESTLAALHAAFQNVKLIQKYGTSEFGSPRTKSRDDGSLWLKMGDEGLRVKIVDGLLWVKTASAMLGYLNADSPFDADGWYCTGDMVEVDGEWMRILGRKSEIINVGGEKVYPHEVENVIMELPFIEDVTVRGERHPLIGQIVCADVALKSPRPEDEATKDIRKHCRSRLPAYKVPVKVSFVEKASDTFRHKKIRR